MSRSVSVPTSPRLARRFVDRQSTHAPVTWTMPWTCSGALVVCVLVLVASVFSGAVYRTLFAGKGWEASREGFGGGLGDRAYAILDERCPLNARTYTTACSGLVRHPTESSIGTCVVRGVEGAGVDCGHGNQTLYDTNYVSSLVMENVEGRPECVLRMLPGISDADAKTYEDKLEAASIEVSRPYLDIAAQLQKARDDLDATRKMLRDTVEKDSEVIRTMNDAISTCNFNNDALQVSVNGLQSRVVQDGVDASVAMAAKVEECNRRSIAKDAERQKALDDAAALCACAKACPSTAPNQYMMVLGDLVSDENNIGGRTWVDKDHMNQCRDKCNDEKDCTHFAFDHGNGGCFLKSGRAEKGNGWPGNGWVTSAISLDRYPKESTTDGVFTW